MLVILSAAGAPRLALFETWGELQPAQLLEKLCLPERRPSIREDKSKELLF